MAKTKNTTPTKTPQSSLPPHSTPPPPLNPQTETTHSPPRFLPLNLPSPPSPTSSFCSLSGSSGSLEIQSRPESDPEDLEVLGSKPPTHVMTRSGRVIRLSPTTTVGNKSKKKSEKLEEKEKEDSPPPLVVEPLAYGGCGSEDSESGDESEYSESLKDALRAEKENLEKEEHLEREKAEKEAAEKVGEEQLEPEIQALEENPEEDVAIEVEVPKESSPSLKKKKGKTPAKVVKPIAETPTTKRRKTPTLEKGKEPATITPHKIQKLEEDPPVKTPTSVSGSGPRNQQRYDPRGSKVSISPPFGQSSHVTPGDFFFNT